MLLLLNIYQVAEVGACLVSADPKRIISIGHSHKICDDDKTSKLGMLNCFLQYCNMNT